MLGVDGRTLRVVWTILLVALVLAVTYQIRETLTVLAVAIFVAYMLAPLVNLVERVTPSRRGLALAIVYILIVSALVVIGINLGSQLSDEAGSFFGRLPALLQGGKLQTFPLPTWLEPLRERIIAAVQHEAAALQASIVPMVQRAGGHILSGLNFLILIVLVPILSFFLLKDAREINDFLVANLSEAGDRSLVRNIVDDIHLLLSKYIRALVILSFVSFSAWALFLYFTHAAYPLLLAVFSGLLEFIPGVGPVVALAMVVTACGISGFSAGLIWIVVFWACFRLFQDYVMNPLVMSSGVEIHPMLVILGVLAGGQLAGLPGLFFSVPAIAILKVLVVRLREAQMRESLLHRRTIP